MKDGNGNGEWVVTENSKGELEVKRENYTPDLATLTVATADRIRIVGFKGCGLMLLYYKRKRHPFAHLYVKIPPRIEIEMRVK